MDERVTNRVQLLAGTCPPPSSAHRDEIDAALHRVAVSLVAIGGTRVFDHALAVLRGVVATWPEGRRPEPTTLSSSAAWVVQQQTRRVDAPTADPLTTRIEAAIAGTLRPVPWPWPALSQLTRSLMPGSVTILGGSPGTSKSFLILQALLHWLHTGIPCALFALEEDRGFWLHRALALASGYGSVTDPDWIAAHPDDARRLMAQHGDEMGNLETILTTAADRSPTLDQLAAWIEARAKDGARLIIADPVTAATVTDARPWQAAQNCMQRAKRAASAAGAAVLLTTHPCKGDARGGKTAPDLDSLAGGASYARFANCVLWLEALPDLTLAPVLDHQGQERVITINRRLRILKTREGRGTGMAVGMHFQSSSLRLQECGVLLHPAQRREATATPVRSRGIRLRQPPQAREDAFAEVGAAG